MGVEVEMISPGDGGYPLWLGLRGAVEPGGGGYYCGTKGRRAAGFLHCGRAGETGGGGGRRLQGSGVWEGGALT